MSKRLKLAAISAAAIAVVFVMALLVGAALHGPADRAGTPREVCKARMLEDLRHFGQVNERAPECNELSQDELTDIELEILTEGEY